MVKTPLPWYMKLGVVFLGEGRGKAVRSTRMEIYNDIFFWLEQFT